MQNKKDMYQHCYIAEDIIPEITSRNFNLRSFAERTAMNTPIQGSAADIIKKAMIDMADRLSSEGLRTRLLLQVHDELIFEAPQEEIEKLKEIVPDVMENCIELKVPLKVDYSYGPTWFDCKIEIDMAGKERHIMWRSRHGLRSRAARCRSRTNLGVHCIWTDS